MNSIEKILSQFTPISIEELDAQFDSFNRKETKFVFSDAILENFLQDLPKSFSILKIQHSFLARYENVYFDNESFTYFKDHVRGKYPRYKIRYRKYLETGDEFFEVKIKTNKGQGQKLRLNKDELNQFLLEKEGYYFDQLRRGIENSYSRITLFHSGMKTKMTLDLDLKLFYDGRLVDGLGNFIVLEIKGDKINNSELGSIFRKYKLRPKKFSKYLLGMIFEFPELKHNRYKHLEKYQTHAV